MTTYNSKYIGCYNDDGSLTHYTHNATGQQCEMYAKTNVYPYFGIRDDGECLLGKFDFITKSEKVENCKKNDNFTYGHDKSIAFYKL